jgi:hypothetical protein
VSNVARDADRVRSKDIPLRFAQVLHGTPI